MPAKAGVDLSYAIGLKPEEAIRYFEDKGYTIGFNWHDVEARAHATAFTVAGVLKQDVLTDIRQGLSDALANGTTLAQFKKDLIPTLQQKGWMGKGLVADADGVLEGKQLTPRRLDTIFQTNMQAAYNAGRYEEQLANVEFRPYWERVAVMDTHTRPAHAALNGFTARYDDPVWQFMYPPDGYHCRCRVRARSEGDVKRHGLTIQDGSGMIETVQQAWGPNDTRQVQALRNPLNGQLYTPDAGFGHNPGQGSLAALGQRLLDRAAVATPQLASLAVDQTLREPTLVSAISNDVKRFVNQTVTQGKPANTLRHVGAIRPDTLNALTRRGITPSVAPLTVYDSGVLAAPASPWASLPELLRQADATLLDDTGLVYVVSNDGVRYAVRADLVAAREGLPLSFLDQGSPLTPDTLAKLGQLTTLTGAL